MNPNNVTDPNLNSSEHTEENIIAKRIVMYGWYPASLSWERVQTDQNGVLQTAGGGSSAGITTVFQGGAPWLISGSVTTYGSSGSAVTTVFQGGAPWTVTGSVNVGNFPVTQNVIATIANASIPVTESGVWGVTATIGNILNALTTVTQGTTPWLVNASIVGVQNVNASVIGVQNVIATVLQGTSPWLVNASVVGIQAVTASIVGVAPVVATYASPWLVTSTNAGGYVANSADANVTGTSVSYIASLTATCVTVKTGNANLYGYHIYNPNTIVTYVSLFAQTLATMGKSAASSQLVIPAGGWADASSSGPPVTYAQGLLVGASASTNGTGNPTSAIIANFWYK